LGAVWGGAIPWCPLRPRRVAGTVEDQPRTQPISHHPITARTEDLLRPLSGGYGEALLSDPNREIIRDTLMKSNAKAKSFHFAVRGNFPAARDFAELDTYTTSRRRAGGNGHDHRNHQHDQERAINDRLVTKTSSQRPSPYERSVERVVATEPQTIRTLRRESNHPPKRASDPSSESSPRSRERTAAAILAGIQQTPGLRRTIR